MLVFLWLLICAPHMNFSKLFIFLTSPYGALTCLSWSVLEKCKTELELLLMYMGDPLQTMAVFCYFFRWVGFVDAIVRNKLRELSSHLLQCKVLIHIIGPKRGDVSKRGAHTHTQTDRAGHWSAVAGASEQGAWKAPRKKLGPDLLWNATINCFALSPMHGWLNVLLNCPDLWGHLADFICHC